MVMSSSSVIFNFCANLLKYPRPDFLIHRTELLKWAESVSMCLEISRNNNARSILKALILFIWSPDCRIIGLSLSVKFSDIFNSGKCSKKNCPWAENYFFTVTKVQEWKLYLLGPWTNKLLFCRIIFRVQGSFYQELNPWTQILTDIFKGSGFTHMHFEPLNLHSAR